MHKNVYRIVEQKFLPQRIEVFITVKFPFDIFKERAGANVGPFFFYFFV